MAFIRPISSSHHVTLHSAKMWGQDKIRGFSIQNGKIFGALDQESRQRNKEAIVGQMLRYRNQVASSVAVKLNSAWVKSEDISPQRQEQSSMGADCTDLRGDIQRRIVERSNTRHKVYANRCFFGAQPAESMNPLLSLSKNPNIKPMIRWSRLPRQCLQLHDTNYPQP